MSNEKQINRIIRDLILILFILIMPMWLMELLEIDVSLQKVRIKPNDASRYCSKAERKEDEEQKDIINEAYLRANSIDAVRGFAYRNGHIRESEELDMARTMILELIDYIKKKEEEK